MASKSPVKHNRPILKLYQPDDSYKKQPLPAPSGTYPYHLKLENFTPVNHHKFSFNMVGDTGGVKYPDGQKKIANLLSTQLTLGTTEDRPSFLYHLGDVVYHFGEAEQYEKQFFVPYKNYTQPIFAIAGNHDSDINPANPVPYKSLDAFTKVFCDSESRDITFAQTARKSMTQPNVYWTLETPLANIIGLHSNVPKYGYIDQTQRDWFINELKTAGKQQPKKLILVCIHHAPYTADFNHASSLPMINFLEDAFKESGILPDAVFSGHVHNYQRFEKTYPNGKIVPYIVCGAGGFDELHSLIYEGDPLYSTDNPLLNDVLLQHYCDAKHGFLKITLERKSNATQLTGNYYTVNPDGTEAENNSCEDQFLY